MSESTPEETVSTIKGFDRSLKCRGFQFEIGTTYTHNGQVEVCASGFHACEYPLDVFTYYKPWQSRYAEVKQFGKLARHDCDSKVASAKITIETEIGIPKIVERAVAWVLAQTKPADSKHAESDRSAASSTGYQSAASSTGDRSAASSTGDQSAASSTGDQSAASSTGDRSAASSTGAQSCAATFGEIGRVMAEKDGCALFLVYRDPRTKDILHAWSGITGRDGIKAATWYSLNADGKPEEFM